MGFRAVRRNHRNLALSVLDHALRDATGTREISPESRHEAYTFLLSEEAEFWAEAAGVNIWKIRRLLHERLDADGYVPELGVTVIP
jgi:hypothetical protein